MLVCRSQLYLLFHRLPTSCRADPPSLSIGHLLVFPSLSDRSAHSEAYASLDIATSLASYRPSRCDVSRASRLYLQSSSESPVLQTQHLTRLSLFLKIIASLPSPPPSATHLYTSTTASTTIFPNFGVLLPVVRSPISPAQVLGHIHLGNTS